MNSPEAFFGALGKVFDIEESGLPKPHGKHEICLYLEGRWRTLRPKVSSIDIDDPIKQLDVSILQDYTLAPLLGIDDPRTSKRIAFVGGIRGEVEAKLLRFRQAKKGTPTG